MRPWIPAATLAALLLSAPCAQAAPTCQTQTGVTTRCGTPGAMPVGWTLSDEDRITRSLPQPAGPSGLQLFYLMCFIGGLFGLIAALPDFDGWQAGDWDHQGQDDED